MTDLAGYLGHFQGAPSARGRRRQGWEAAEQEALTSAASLKWWFPGYQHHEPARESKAEAWKLARQGVKPGWPDVTLHIPMVQRAESEDGIRILRVTQPRLLAALELKAQHRAPKSEVSSAWWLEWAPEIDPLKPDPTRYGLQWEQARQLQRLHAVGYLTCVAYGWEAALKWLDAVSGPRPEVLPDGW